MAARGRGKLVVRFQEPSWPVIGVVVVDWPDDEAVLDWGLGGTVAIAIATIAAATKATSTMASKTAVLLIDPQD